MRNQKKCNGYGTRARTIAALLSAALALSGQTLFGQTKKQVEDQRIELLRGLGSEYATAQTYLPRSKTPLDRGSGHRLLEQGRLAADRGADQGRPRAPAIWSR